MISHESLVLFTQTEEWTATTSQQTAISPSNIFVRRQSRFGSAPRQAFLALNNILFLQRGSRKFRDFTYGSTEAGGKSADLTTLAEHITDGGIKQIAYQQQPDPILWFVTNDGLLLSLTYEANENVIAWARHPTEGTVESVAVIYGDADASDEVWMIANRDNGRMVERLDPSARANLENDVKNEYIYVDSAKVFSYPSAKTLIDGLIHLEGETVSILADGAVQSDKVVANGAITLDYAASNVVVGLGYTSVLQPSKIEIELKDGTSQGRKFLCKRVTFNLWKTLGLEYADSAVNDNWFDVESLEMATLLGDSQGVFTGLVDVNNYGGYRENVDVTVRARLPLPCNILAMIPKFDVHGD
jgi:hypothetical protein